MARRFLDIFGECIRGVFFFGVRTRKHDFRRCISGFGVEVQDFLVVGPGLQECSLVARFRRERSAVDHGPEFLKP